MLSIVKVTLKLFGLTVSGGEWLGKEGGIMVGGMAAGVAGSGGRRGQPHQAQDVGHAPAFGGGGGGSGGR
jgi:hypothetical protein